MESCAEGRVSWGYTATQRAGTHESNPCSSLAKVVVATEKVEDGEVHASEVILGEAFKRRQVGSQGSQAVHRPLEDVSLRWRGRCSGEERVEGGCLQASLLGDLVPSDEGAAQGRVSAGEKIGADNME